MEKMAASSSLCRKSTPTVPSLIVRNLRAVNPKFRVGRQEDAHEFLRFFLESLQKFEMGKAKVQPFHPKSLISKVFEGRLVSIVKCMSCGTCSRALDPFMDISLSLGSRTSSIETALSQFCAVEALSGGNVYNCSVCRKKTKASKGMKVETPPTTLCLLLKRFSFQFGFGPGKVSSSISFPLELNVSKFLENHDTKSQCLYDLSGVVVHLGGGCGAGHYIAFVKAPNGSWYKMDDESVSQVGVQTVLSQKAYMLFYSQRPSKSECQSARAINLSKKVVESPQERSEPVNVADEVVISSIQKTTLQIPPSAMPLIISVFPKRVSCCRSIHVSPHDRMLRPCSSFDTSIGPQGAPEMLLLPKQASVRRQRNSWDREYDKGRERKRRNVAPAQSSHNPFQRLSHGER